MAVNNFNLKGFLNDPKVQANKPAAIKYLQQKGIIDAQGKPIENLSNQTSTPSVLPGGQNQPTSQTDDTGSSLPATIGGVLGSIGGGIVGTAIEPGGGTLIGGVAGGALGQSLGEVASEWLSKKPFKLSSIVKQGAEGSLYGFIPEGEELSIPAKIGMRALVGAGIGGATQAIGEVGESGTLGEKAQKVATAATVGGIAFPVVGGGLDALGGALKFLGQKIPKDLYDQVTKAPKEVADFLHNKVQQLLVGHDNVDYAIANNIIPKNSGITTQVINDSLKNAETKAQEVESKLQALFKKAGSSVSIMYKKSSLKDLIDGIMTKIPNYMNPSGLRDKLLGIAMDDVEKNYGKGATITNNPISLEAVNNMKRTIGDNYKNQDFRSIYHDFKTFIVKSASELGDKINSLNQEGGKLIDIKGILSDWKSLPKNLPDQFTPEAIDKAVQEAALKNPKSLDTLLNLTGLMGLMGALGGFALTKSVTGAAVGGLGLTFGLRSTIRQAIDSYFSNPETRMETSKVLMNAYDKITNVTTKAKLGNIIQALGIRIPSFIGGAMNQQYNTPPQLNQPKPSNVLGIGG